LADFSHQTVLLQEAVDVLQPGAGKVIIDGTLGGGGHTEALLARGATVLGVDRDPVALEAARARLAAYPGFSTRQGNFGDLLEVAADLLPVDGVLVDLGVSSPQLDVAERGFSFQKAELVRILREYGEEPFAKAIARELKRTPPTRTLEAAEVVKRAVPRKAWPQKIHVATRTFQALRMAVNQELESLESLLAALPRLLKVGGRAAVISFHSLEDRKVKETFRELVGTCKCPPGLPVCACGYQGDFALVSRKAIAASDEEIAANPRARSAHLRAVEKVR
jgi:16S rRNA (cytosine1402-N4)-methyltransferase